MLKILYLCDKKHWEHKLDRVRFHSIETIGNNTDVTVFKSGPGWDDFDNVKQVADKYNPDIILWYKPLEMPGFDQVNDIPCCLRYNEMWDVRWTTEEIQRSGSSLILCHHQNDIRQYGHIKTAEFFHNPHCVSKNIFRDYGLMRECDVLVTGALSPTHYPLRARFQRVINSEILRNFNCRILRHPGYNIENVEQQIVDYATELNKAKIVLACSSKHRYALSKYVEVPLCKSLLCGDIPDENHNWYKGWMLEIDNKMTNDEIAEKIAHYVVYSNDRNKLVEKGYSENVRHRTLDIYSKKFIGIVNNFLLKKG